MITHRTHTPTPWKVGEEYEILGPNEKVVATAYHNRPEVEANAAYIVKCVNAHKALLDVLKEAKNLIDNYSDSMESFDSGNLEKAIAKAEEKS